jgi:hypothetical protein
MISIFFLDSLVSAYVSDPTDTTSLSTSLLALDYWFGIDYVSSNCVDSGGVASGNCPRSTLGL